MSNQEQREEVAAGGGSSTSGSRGTHPLAFDIQQMRPGCVLVQAGMGGDVAFTQRHFPPETWLLSPTPAMKVYPTTDEQARKLVAMSLARIGAPQAEEGDSPTSSPSSHDEVTR